MPKSHTTALCLALAFAAPAAAQADWNAQSPATVPPPHSDHVLVFEFARNTTLLFGGTSPGGGPWNETWTWSGTDWTRAMPPTSPPPRTRHAGAHDVFRGSTVIFGGSDAGGLILNDTWEWDGATWTQRMPATSPPPRDDHAMAFDPNGGVLLFGGRDVAGGTLNDTWRWDGTNWTQLTPAASPPPRRDITMVGDTARQRVVLFGGFPGASICTAWNDTWEWDGTTWAPQTPVQSPPARGGHAMAYDWFRRRTVVFSGYACQNLVDTWEWDGVAWERRLPLSAPTGRSGHAMAYDFTRLRTVLFAGYDTGFQTDTWEYFTSALPSFTAFGSGCPVTSGQAPTLALQEGRPWIGDSFRVRATTPSGGPAFIFLVAGLSNTSWQGMSLPLGLAPYGMPGCLALVSVDAVLAAAAPSGTADFNIAICACPAVIGASFYQQALVLDAAAGNAAGAVVSNAATIVLGAR